MVTGGCHCSNVQLKILKPVDRLTCCNCSVCRRIGALWAYYPSAAVQISVTKPDSLGSYSWGDRCLKFRFCQQCGCHTHYESTPQSGVDRVGVNMRQFDLQIWRDLPVRYFDGADSWQEVDEPLAGHMVMPGKS